MGRISKLAAAAAALTLGLAAPAGAQTPWTADGDPGSFGYEFSRRLYHESLVSARDFAEARQDDAGQTADFAYGVTLFLGAVEGLVGDLSRHGLRRDDIGGLPFLRLLAPPPSGPTERMTYARFREILQRFTDRLAAAEAVLRTIDDPDATLALRPSGVRLDMNGDGAYDPGERLFPVLMQVVDPFSTDDDTYWSETAREVEAFVGALATGDPEALEALDRIAPAFGYDRADAAWLAGYAHLLSAMTEFVLAHDFEASFDHSFHVFFPSGEFPFPELGEIYRLPVGGGFGFFVGEQEMAYIFDLAAFAVNSPWDVTDPEKMRAVRLHLKEMIGFSRKSWRFAETETDNLKGGAQGPYPEWIPHPAQRGTTGLPQVTDTVLEGWTAFLDVSEAVLDGTLLIPHWRFERGINLRRFFEEPRPFSPILIAQGADAIPYLEEGPEADAQALEPALSLLGGDFFTYAIWFN